MRFSIVDRLVCSLVDAYVLLYYYSEFKPRSERAQRSKFTSLSVAAPRIANFKFLWRKLFDHDPRFTAVSDKLAAKRFVAELGMDVDMPKTLWEGAADDIPVEYLQADVVIKSNHGWNTSLFPKRDGLDVDTVKRGIEVAIAQRHGVASNEWAYFDIQPKMFVEERIDTEDPLVELKMYTYGPQVLRVIKIRTIRKRWRVASVWLLDKQGRLVRSNKPSAISPRYIDKAPLPQQTREALKIAKEIGGFFDHMRVDFLIAGERLLLGELTVYSQAGYLVGGDADTSEYSRNWDIRRSWFLNASHRGWRKYYAKSLARFCAVEAQKDRVLNKAGPLSREDYTKSMEIAERLLKADS